MTESLRQNLTAVYRENLEGDIIATLAELAGISVRRAMDVFYRSRLASQISEGRYGIDNLDPKYLAADLLENEPVLFSETPPQ